jgi:hypothetical protein
MSRTHSAFVAYRIEDSSTTSTDFVSCWLGIASFFVHGICALWSTEITSYCSKQREYHLMVAFYNITTVKSSSRMGSAPHSHVNAASINGNLETGSRQPSLNKMNTSEQSNQLSKFDLDCMRHGNVVYDLAGEVRGQSDVKNSQRGQSRRYSGCSNSFSSPRQMQPTDSRALLISEPVLDCNRQTRGLQQRSDDRAERKEHSEGFDAPPLKKKRRFTRKAFLSRAEEEAKRDIDLDRIRLAKTSLFRLQDELLEGTRREIRKLQ